MYGERIAKWEKAVEWPLTLAAVLFLVVVFRQSGVVLKHEVSR